MSSTRSRAGARTLGQPKILVLGDLILDRYTWGNAERISQEAPVIVLRADRREARLGGAANVANMLAALEARVTCCGVVGDDRRRRRVAASCCRRRGVDCELVLADDAPSDLGQGAVRRPGRQPPSQPDPARRSREVRPAVRVAWKPTGRATRGPGAAARRAVDLRLRQGRLHAAAAAKRRSRRPGARACR